MPDAPEPPKVEKPDPRIFQLLLERIGRSAEACVYIDDNPKNAAAAAALGFDAVHFKSPEQLRAELTRLGVLEGQP